MTDRPHVAARDIQRWPADPDQLVDTTRCPACFTRLDSTRCRECGLELGVPAATTLLAVSTRMHGEVVVRRALITRMRAEQAAAERAASRPVGLGEPAAPDVTVPAAAPAQPSAATPSASIPSPPTPAAPVGDAAAPRSQRSSVQVLLLTLGVVLISITAIVFLFVAYLVATLEVRSVIIAVASVLVLGVAWLVRARRLPGTAEGVASVAIVLLLLDVWIVRANGLFGTDVVDAAGYTGGALLVVALVLAGVRAVSGIRVAGFAASGLAPVGVFLLAFQAAPEGEIATGLWLGCLAASLLGTLAVLTPRTIERVIVLVAGFAAGAFAVLPAAWALPEVEWNELWAFLAVGAAWLVALGAVRSREAVLSPVLAPLAAAALGVSVALAPAVSIFSELDLELAIWLAPAATGVVACVFAAGLRLSAPMSKDALWAFITAASVAFIAAVPGAYYGLGAIGSRLMASIPPWRLDADATIDSLAPEYDLGAILVPFVVAAGSLVVVALARRLRTLAAVPIAAALTGVLVIGALVPGASISVVVFVVVAAGTLALAAMLRRVVVPGLLVTLLILGTSGGALAWWVGYSSADVWPWAAASVLVTIVAGRVVARRVWPADAAARVGAVHLALAATLAASAVFSISPWLESSGVALASPWTSPWMWLATVGSALLVAAAFVRAGTPADRLATVGPLFAASAIALVAVAYLTDSPLRWLPAVIFVVAGLLWLRLGTSPAMQTAFSAATPLALALASGPIADELLGPEFVGVGVAGAALLAAALAHVVLPAGVPGARLGWSIAVGLSAVAALLLGATDPNAADQLWLVLLLLTPVPIVMAALDGDPIAGQQPSRHLAWVSLGLAVATVWTWLAGDGVDNVEAYTLPLAAALALAGGLITWRRVTDDSRASGRTALFGAAAAVAVLPSVASSGDSELRTLVLASIGIVVAIAAGFLPESARGVPVRLLGVAAGWVAVSGAALVRGSAVATGTEDSVLVIEFWPLVALAAGIAIAVSWARSESQPSWLGEVLLAASVALAAIPTLIAIISGEQPTLRAAVLFPLLAVAHIAASATTARPVAGPMLGWTTLGALVFCALVVLGRADIDPFDIVTASVGVALIGAGAFRMRRSPELGSWPALGAGLAVLMLPALLADFTDPELWRNVTLGVVAAAAVIVGAMRRLQAPLLIGGAVLLVHAIVQLWPWISDLYEAVWWWLWLGVAGVLLVVLAATYERQLRLARSTVRSIAALR